MTDDSLWTGLFKFVMSSGRVVSLDELRIRLTHAGLLEGSPDPEYNQWRVQREVRAPLPIWGERPTYVCTPTMRRVTEAGRSYDRLPELCYHAWLSSHPIDPSQDGSELVAIWFGPREPDVPLREIVTRALEHIPWEEIAKDFEY